MSKKTYPVSDYFKRVSANDFIDFLLYLHDEYGVRLTDFTPKQQLLIFEDYLDRSFVPYTA